MKSEHLHIITLRHNNGEHVEVLQIKEENVTFLDENLTYRDIKVSNHFQINSRYIHIKISYNSNYGPQILHYTQSLPMFTIGIVIFTYKFMLKTATNFQTKHENIYKLYA